MRSIHHFILILTVFNVLWLLSCSECDQFVAIGELTVEDREFNSYQGHENIAFIDGNNRSMVLSSRARGRYTEIEHVNQVSPTCDQAGQFLLEIDTMRFRSYDDPKYQIDLEVRMEGESASEPRTSPVFYILITSSYTSSWWARDDGFRFELGSEPHFDTITIKGRLCKDVYYSSNSSGNSWEAIDVYYSQTYGILRFTDADSIVWTKIN